MLRKAVTGAAVILLFTVASAQQSNRVYMNLPSDKMDTEGMIQKQIMVKRMPIIELQKQNTNIRLESDILKDFSLYLRDLETYSRNLYDFQTPFRDMLGESSDPSIVEIFASRNAQKDDYQIKVIRTAKPDSFMSASLPRDRMLPAGDFSITMDGKVYNIRFPGGTLAALAKSIEMQAKDAIEIKMVNDTPLTSILVLSGKETGLKNRMSFQGRLDPLFSSELLVNGVDKKENVVLDLSAVNPLTTNGIKAERDLVYLPALSGAELNTAPYGFQIRDRSLFTFKAGWKMLPVVTNVPPLVILSTNIMTNIMTNVVNLYSTNFTTNIVTAVLTNTNKVDTFDILAMEPMRLGDFTIDTGALQAFYNDRSVSTNKVTNIAGLENTNQLTNVGVDILTNPVSNLIRRDPPPVVSNFTQMITLVMNDGSRRTVDVDREGDFQVTLAPYAGKTPVKIIFNNGNTEREVTFSSLVFSTVISEGGIQPKNVITKAEDALFLLDGVEITRDKNDITDLITGLTLRLKSESDRLVTAKVDHDYQKIYDGITNWVDSYNKVMQLLYIMTKPDLGRLPLADRLPENVRDGVFSAEPSMLSIRDRLRAVAMNAYKTQYGRELALLEQIGIYTKKPGSFSSGSDEWENAKRGVLTIDKDKLMEQLKTRLKGVEELFANDITGDGVKNSGVSIETTRQLKVVLGEGSFIKSRISMNDGRIKKNTDKIAELNRDLLDYEAQLRRRYGQMNQAVNESDSRRKWMDSQFKQ